MYPLVRRGRFASTLLAATLAFSSATTAGVVAGPLLIPTVSDYQLISAGETPPTEAQCFSVGRRCFSPQATRAAYNLPPLYAAGKDGRGRTIAIVSHIPGNVLNGNFRVALYLDEGTSDPQQEALLNVYGGKLGGPVAELAKLIGEVVSVERAPIRFDVNEGRGTLSIGEVSHADLEPYKGPDGSTTTLSNESILSRFSGVSCLDRSKTCLSSIKCN